MALKVGHITYANCAPFFHYLQDCGFSGEIVGGVPAELNQLLAAGQIDLCPSSSIEYAVRAEDYLLLPDHSISAIGPVQSVLLFTDIPVSGLNGVPISITGESATSVALLQVLLKEFFQIPEVVFEKKDFNKADGDAQLPMLLIGDRALKMRRECTAECMVIDLGELWYHFTGLPFVFALWIVHCQAAQEKAGEIREFSRQLSASKEKAFSSLDRLADVVAEMEWMGKQGLVNYWRQVSYDFDPLHVEGLNCFYYLLEKNGLIEKAPELSFFK